MTTAAARLLDMSGLSTGQVARAVGCTKRTLTGYLLGTLPSAEHQTGIDGLIAVIEPLGNTPDGRRRTLLASSNGPSLLRRLIAEHPTGEVLQFTLPVRDRLGV